MDWFSKNLPYLLAGVSVGGQYALIAIGYTMVYGILRLINFAHGDIFYGCGPDYGLCICFYADVYFHSVGTDRDGYSGIFDRAHSI